MARRAMKVRAQLRHARLDGREWRVLRPDPVLDTALLFECEWHTEMYVDRRAAYQIGVLSLLAARSRHTIIHLPLRAGRIPAEPERTGRPLDLVLSHHTAQLRVSRWPRIRAALGPARPHTVRIPAERRPVERPYWRTRDRLYDRIHADTMFLTGSAPVFRHAAEYFFDLAFRAPGSAPGEESPHHACAEVDLTCGVLVNADNLHMLYRAHWLPSAEPVGAPD
ncbi:hypothetical protein [Amycolatopsis rubida]|uniref:Uncharacterized protein n=1 Tax=Amycolatopsis rubida TaxID=112413 RepID=A0A1I5DJ51_9PSEU|nr:hypothetical protein [Amycolatopsis rubida]SFN98831.1 hypothetical protein SAMN05421854_101233 [Amycolatopsis rubida]